MASQETPMTKPDLPRQRATLPRALADLALPAVLVLLAACATSTAQQRGPTGVLPARARYLAYAGAPVDHFTWLNRYMGWEALSDDELVLFLSPTRAYYIRVWSPCGDRGGLRWVYHVEVPKTGGAVYSGFDSVLADHWRCPISQIRPVDWGRMKADARAAHNALPAAAPGANLPAGMTSPPPSGARGPAMSAPPPGAGPQPGGGPPPDTTPPPDPQ
jgi:hypothetical protein